MDNPNLESEILHKVSGICSLLNLSGVHSITDIQKYQLRSLTLQGLILLDSFLASFSLHRFLSTSGARIKRAHAQEHTKHARISQHRQLLYLTFFTFFLGRELSGEQQLLLLADEKRKKVYDY